MRKSRLLLGLGWSSLFDACVVTAFTTPAHSSSRTQWPRISIKHRKTYVARCRNLQCPLSSDIYSVNENTSPQHPAVLCPDKTSQTAGASSSSTLTAASQDESESAAVVPSYKELLLFLFTTILIWLSEPVLSLVDATVIGSLKKSESAIIQLAAIGPATTFYDSLVFMTYFLAIATTNKLTKANAGRHRNYRQLQTITSHVLGVASVLGLLTTLFCYACGPRLLQNMVLGGSGTALLAVATPAQRQLLHYAGRYTAIRASVSIAGITGMVMQAFCLATLDTRTPILAVLAASVVNVSGDLLLRPWGVQGAAVATAVATVASTGVLFGAVRRKMNEWRTLEQKESYIRLQPSEVNGTELSLSGDTQSVMSSKNVQGEKASPAPSNESNVQPVPIASLPDRKSLIELLKLSGPIFFVILAKIACYGAMTLRSTDFGVVPLAAHNIMMRIFFFYSTFGDSISQTAQTYLPSTLYPTPDTKSFTTILKRLLTIATVVSITNSQICVLILKHCGRFLVRDARIVALMSQNTGFVGLALLLHPFIMFLEGTVIAARDFRTLLATYVATLGLHFSVLTFFCPSFPAIWRTFFLFQLIRTASFSWNVWRRQHAIRRSNGGTDAPAALPAPAK